MLSHVFSHDGDAYEVSFQRMDGQWFAALRRQGDEVGQPLRAFAEDEVGAFSDQAIRVGYISLAQWLAKHGNGPNAAINSAPCEDETAGLVVIRDKAAPCLNREAHELIGRDMQEMYADVLEEPLPDNLLALLAVTKGA